MTTATSEAISDADRYLKEVTPYLAGLPAEERADLLEDLALHLHEVAAEPGPPLEERLGPPAAYAAELLTTAGFAVSPPEKQGAIASARQLAAWLRRSAAGREAERTWPFLRPAWWVIRAWLAVYVLADLATDRRSIGFPIPDLFGSPVLGLAALAVALPASIRLGQRELHGIRRAAVAAADVLLLLVGLSLAGHMDPTSEVSYVDSGPADGFVADACLRNGDGSRITNLYAYGPDGQLLDPVLLYDQDGRPIDNLCPEFDDQGRRLVTEYRRDTNGAAVINAFPRRQATALDPFADRKRGAAQPATPVPVNPPSVVVPRLTPTTTVTTALTPTTTVPPTTAVP